MTRFSEKFSKTPTLADSAVVANAVLACKTNRLACLMRSKMDCGRDRTSLAGAEGYTVSHLT